LLTLVFSAATWLEAACTESFGTEDPELRCKGDDARLNLTFRWAAEGVPDFDQFFACPLFHDQNCEESNRATTTLPSVLSPSHVRNDEMNSRSVAADQCEYAPSSR